MQSLQTLPTSCAELVMSDQAETESASQNAILALGVCSSTDLNQSTYGSGGSSVEPNSTYTFAPDGPCGEWNWQMLAHRQQYQQQDSLQQQQQYQQQTQSQSFQYGPICQVPNRSKVGAFGPSTLTPQVRLPWTQPTTQLDPGQYGVQDLRCSPKAAMFSSEQQVADLPDAHWSAPSVAQSTLDMRSDYGAVKP